MFAFERRAIDEFVEYASRHLWTYYPGGCAFVGGSAEVTAFVRRTVERGKGYGIESRGAVLAFAELLLQFGENFERSPIREWTMNMLAHPVLPGSAKVEGILERHLERTQGRVIIPF